MNVLHDLVDLSLQAQPFIGFELPKPHAAEVVPHTSDRTLFVGA
jgi:hypothetical protein